MNKSKEVLEIIEEINKTISSIEDVKVGDMVQFVKGHELEGIVGLVNDIHKDGTVTVRIGNNIRVGIPIKYLLKVSGLQF